MDLLSPARRAASSRRWRGGFTLTELLVTTAVLTLLAGVLLPALAGARDAARGAPCAGNLHQIALAFTTYFQDYDDAFPPSRVGSIEALDDLNALWFRQIGPYLKSPAVLHCPADNVRDARRTLSAALPALWNRLDLPALSYGANWELMKAAAAGRPAARITALADPAHTLLVADCTEPWAFGPVYTDAQGVRWSHLAYANGPPEHAPTALYNGGRSGMGQERHGTGSYIAYLDGHIAFLPAARFYRGARFLVTDRSGEGHAVLEQRPLLAPDALSPDAASEPP